MSNKQPSPDQTGGWAIDWEELESISMEVNEYTVHAHPTLIRKIIEALRRQQAAQGIVEVRREDLEAVMSDDASLDALERLDEALAVAKDQDR